MIRVTVNGHFLPSQHLIERQVFTVLSFYPYATMGFKKLVKEKSDLLLQEALELLVSISKLNGDLER